MKTQALFGKKKYGKLTKDIFVERSNKIHNNYYDYSLVSYKNTYQKIDIICPKHGIFKQVPKYHMGGSMCRKCSNEVKSEKTKYKWSDKETFILKENFPKYSIAHCSKILKLDRSTVKSKIIDLGLGEHIMPKKQQVAWGYKDITSERWYSIMSGAKNRNLEFDITIEDVWNLYLNQNKKCALTGWPVKYSKIREKTTASLDRIDSKKGYTKDNVQILHRLVNKLKLDSPQDVFLKMCLDIAKTHKNKKIIKKISHWEIDVWNDTEFPIYEDIIDSSSES
jgi:hypothetical protein